MLLKELDWIMVKYFGPDMPPISQLEKRASLALIGSHPIIDNVRPLLDTIIPVAGMHIKEAAPLPTVIFDILRNGSVNFKCRCFLVSPTGFGSIS